MKTIISASRRTDIPAFYYDWFQNALQAKQVSVTSPVYKDVKYTVDLNPDTTHSIVLWSKNFKNVLERPEYLTDYNLYFQYTITGYSKLLEPNVPEYSETLKTLEGLLKYYKPEQFNIRFDPIILSTKGEIVPNFAKPGLARLEMFDRLCSDLKSLGMENCRVTVSYISLYPKVVQKLNSAGIDFIDLSEKQQIEFMKRMSAIADKYNRDIYTCANDRFVNAGIENIKKGHCIDSEILTALFGKCTTAHATGQREQCGCVKAKDIGAYLPCRHQCAYCYAQ